jgi:hypothetical protein
MPDLELVPVEFLKEIGEVSLRWNVIDNLLNLVLISLLKLDIYSGENNAPFIHMAFNQKLEVLSCLVKGRCLPEDSPLVVRFKAVVPILKSGNTSRNTIVHSVWRVKEGVVAYQSLKARGVVEFIYIPVTIKFLQDANKHMENTRQAMLQLLAAIGTRPRSSPQIGQYLKEIAKSQGMAPVSSDK